MNAVNNFYKNSINKLMLDFNPYPLRPDEYGKGMCECPECEGTGIVDCTKWRTEEDSEVEEDCTSQEYNALPEMDEARAKGLQWCKGDFCTCKKCEGMGCVSEDECWCEDE